MAAGIAPLVVSLVLFACVWFYAGSEGIFVLVALLPASYATLFFFVLPTLSILRRFKQETGFSMSVACGGATLAPWFALYLAFFPAGTGKYSGAPAHVMGLLALPALLAAVAGLVVHRLGAAGSRKDAAHVNP
jgi:hypothetical protein